MDGDTLRCPGLAADHIITHEVETSQRTRVVVVHLLMLLIILCGGSGGLEGLLLLLLLLFGLDSDAGREVDRRRYEVQDVSDGIREFILITSLDDTTSEGVTIVVVLSRQDLLRLFEGHSGADKARGGLGIASIDPVRC